MLHRPCLVEMSENGMASKRLWIGSMLIGEQREGKEGFARSDKPLDLIEDPKKGREDSVRWGPVVLFECLPPPLLLLCHPPLPPQRGKIESVEELGILAYEQVNVVGKVLGEEKGLEPVCNEVLAEGKRGTETTVHGKGLVGEAGDAV
jgi:hypothetical protein